MTGWGAAGRGSLTASRLDEYLTNTYNHLVRPPPIQLETLGQLPSWCNKAGRVDRCACEFIRAAQLWPWAADWRRVSAAPVPGTRRPRAKVRLIADAKFSLHVNTLRRLLNAASPRLLRGHDRTTRSHPMKPRRTSLHLDDDWRQVVTIQRWRLHRDLTMHFLVCPACETKSRMLYMPRCTDREHADAVTAFAYLQTYDATMNAPRTDDVIQIIERYILLFPPRRLLCRACLRVRYGCVRNAPGQRKSRFAKSYHDMFNDPRLKLLRLALRKTRAVNELRERANAIIPEGWTPPPMPPMPPPIDFTPFIPGPRNV